MAIIANTTVANIPVVVTGATQFNPDTISIMNLIVYKNLFSVVSNLTIPGNITSGGSSIPFYWGS